MRRHSLLRLHLTCDFMLSGCLQQSTTAKPLQRALIVRSNPRASLCMEEMVGSRAAHAMRLSLSVDRKCVSQRSSSVQLVFQVAAIAKYNFK